MAPDSASASSEGAGNHRYGSLLRDVSLRPSRAPGDTGRPTSSTAAARSTETDSAMGSHERIRSWAANRIRAKPIGVAQRRVKRKRQRVGSGSQQMLAGNERRNAAGVLGDDDGTRVDRVQHP